MRVLLIILSLTVLKMTESRNIRLSDDPYKTPSSKINDNGLCYRFYLLPHLTWTDAEKYCESTGSHLVNIRNNITNEYLKRL